MKLLEDMEFYTETKGGKFVGRVREFVDLRTRPMVKRLDAVDGIITLTAERVREIVSSQIAAKTEARKGRA